MTPPPPPPLGQGPRVPPSHVPTLTEVIELGPDEAGGLSLEDAPAPVEPWTATQPAALEQAAAPGAAAPDDAGRYPDLSDPLRDPLSAAAPPALEQPASGTPPGPAEPHAAPAVAASPLPLPDERAPHAATGPGQPEAAPAHAPLDAQPPVTGAAPVTEPAPATEPAPVSPVFAAPPATWRADPDLPAFLLAGRAAAVPGEPGEPGPGPAHAALDASAPSAMPSAVPTAVPSGLPPGLPPLTSSPTAATPTAALPVLSQALDDWPPAAPSALPQPPAPGVMATVTAAPADQAGAPAEPPPAPASAALPETWREEQLVQQVLADVQRHADAMLEFRLREALGPVLARVTDELVRGARQEMAATLRDIVARAVAQELARQRSR